jgi:hypothetical protein
MGRILTAQQADGRRTDPPGIVSEPDGTDSVVIGRYVRPSRFGMDMLTSSERRRLDDEGYLALEGVVEPRRGAAMRARLGELLTVTPHDHAGTLIAGGLLDEAVFDAAWLRPRVLAAVRHVLGDACRLTGLASRGVRPGHGQQALHVD